MAGIDDIFKSGLGGGLAVVVGAAILGPVVVPALARAVKPVIKGAIKGGVIAYGWSREGLEEAREYLEDTYHEAVAELEHDGDGDESAGGAARGGRGRGRTRKTAEETG